MQGRQGDSVTGTLQTPYSPAVKAGDYIFVSGQTGFVEPKTGKNLEGIEAQTIQCLNNMESVLKDTGASLSDVVKVTIFLKNEQDFLKVNEIYVTYFVNNKPARSTVITGLLNPKMLVEIECIACCSR